MGLFYFNYFLVLFAGMKSYLYICKRNLKNRYMSWSDPCSECGFHRADCECMNRKRDLVEPKEILVKMMQEDEELGLYEEPNIIDKWLEENGSPEIANQVELEAENYVRNHPDFEAEGFSEYQNGVFNGFIEGAKWQQDNNYSEEEVLDLLNKFDYYPTMYKGNSKSEIEQWFEQFKKK